MKEEEDYRREDIEWLKKQIEKMDSEENLEENSTRQILDDELNEFFMKLSCQSFYSIKIGPMKNSICLAEILHNQK